MIKELITKIFSTSGQGVKNVFDGAGDFAKDIKTIVTGKIDKETEILLYSKLSEIESKINEMQAKVIVAESAGNWLQKSWRPFTMLTFLVLTVLNQFSLLAIPLSAEVWELFKIGLGGYIAGRSIEKITGRV